MACRTSCSHPAHGDAARLPALGPHYFSGLDVGNLYDRSGRCDYVSPPFDAGPNPSFGGLTWDADTPFRTRVELQVRTAATEAGLQEAGWRGPGGRPGYFRQSGEAVGPTPAGHRWIQYKATLVSPNCANTPVLRAVELQIESEGEAQ